MKPLLLEIQAFGPFVDKQIVDFEKLSEKGIFLIKGKTGSGKTTIFDAMTFALYGGGSGTSDNAKNGRNSIEEWRCKQAPDNLPTIVSFIFSSHGTKYRFERRLIKKRVNYSEENAARRIEGDGTETPLFSNPKGKDVTQKAEELIGLTKDQFRQVVLLPQGQFERFLVASSDEKETILKKIFSADQWTAYAEAFYENARDRKNALDNIKTEIDASLGDDGFSDINELEDKIKDIEKEKIACEDSHKAFNSADRQNVLNEDISLSKEFASLHSLEAEETDLLNKKSGIDNKRSEYKNSEDAEKVRKPISDYEDAKKEYETRKNTFDKLAAEIPKAEQDEANAGKALSEHEGKSPIASLIKVIGELESKRGVYASIEALDKAFTIAEKEISNAEKDFNKADGVLTKATEEAKAAKDNYDTADGTAKDYRNKYYAGIYGEIASELKENEVCPICGSTSHPAPAKKLPNSVSKSDMEAKEEEAGQAKKIWDEAEGKRVKAETDKNAKRNIRDEKQKEYTKAESEYNNAKKNLITGIPNSIELEKKISSANKEIDTYKDKTAALQTALSEASNKRAALQANKDNAKVEADTAFANYNTAKNKLEAALVISGFRTYDEVKQKLRTDNERKKLNDEIVKYDTSLADTGKKLSAKRTELDGKTEPDATKFADRQQEINDELARYNGEKARLNADSRRLSNKRDVLQKKQSTYDDNIAEAESDFKFAKALRGDTGVGLQRYVLAIMFNQVIGEANRMLSQIHGGRYHLFRTDDRGVGNKKGLELKVYDNRVPGDETGRGVSMLSGGEKFLVSLALSIGMSTIAQKTGVQIEALFIDEGFGTLDDDSISDAMDVLESVRKGAGTIGIISHVSLLEDNVPVHLDVIKSDSGSTIKKV